MCVCVYVCSCVCVVDVFVCTFRGFVCVCTRACLCFVCRGCVSVYLSCMWVFVCACVCVCLCETNDIHFSTGIRLRSPCIPPVNTVPHGGQIIVHSTSQHSTTWRSDHHSTTWWSDHRAFRQLTQCHMVVRSSCIPPVNTITWWSDHCAFHQSAQYLSLIHI